MKTNKKTLINLFVSLTSQVIIFVLGLLVPRIVLLNYGSDVNGVTGTISQIFTYVALLEAGIALSARNAFYKPIKENNRDGISFVASLAKKYYKKITLFYLGAIALLAFALPVVLKTSIDYWTIFVYTLFEGLVSAISFYFINTWSTFLKANGDTYVVEIISLITKILCYTVKIILSMQTINIAYIQIGYLAVSVVQLAVFSIYMKKKFSWIKYDVDVGKATLPDKNANLISEIAWVVFSSTDMIILSIFLSTQMSSVYSIYNMVYVAINSILLAAYNSVNYHLGQTYSSEKKDKYIKLHDAFNSFFIGAVCCLMSVTYFLIIPFVKLYTAGVNDIEYIYPALPILFCLIQILSWSRYVNGNLIGISFRQKPAVKINVLEAIINLVFSIILVNFMGIVGVVLATVIALPIKVIYCTYVGDKIILKRSVKNTIKIMFINYLLFGISVILQSVLKVPISSYLDFVIVGVCLTLICTVIYAIANIITNKDILKLLSMIKEK